MTKQRLLNAAAAATTKCRHFKTAKIHKLIKHCQCPEGYVATDGFGDLNDMNDPYNFNDDDGCVQKDGGVLGGGYLLGLVAFARKFARCILTLTMLFAIVFITFYLCSTSRETSSLVPTNALLHVTEAEYTLTTYDWN